MREEESIHEVMPNLYRLEIPLPDTPLQVLNSYVIKGDGRNLIIDTGFNHLQCLETMQEGLKVLGVDLRETDIFVTHYHSDHAGLLPKLVTDTTMVYCSEQDSFRVFSNNYHVNSYWDDFRRFLLKHGFPETQINAAAEHNPGYKYSSNVRLNHTTLRDGDSISAGSYRFRCIETPGHTKGHTCLYEPDKKLLLAGDHILPKITPNISLNTDDGNPLKEYLQSLDKVESMDVELALPGHRSIMTNCRERILELKHHYLKRVAEVIDVLKAGDKTAYQVAAAMKWDLSFKAWDLFPPTHKLFALWEALANLKYIEEQQIIKREVREQKVIFSLNPELWYEL